jgi:hypothetical protein
MRRNGQRGAALERNIRMGYCFHQFAFRNFNVGRGGSRCAGNRSCLAHLQGLTAAPKNVENTDVLAEREIGRDESSSGASLNEES